MTILVVDGGVSGVGGGGSCGDVVFLFFVVIVFVGVVD